MSKIYSIAIDGPAAAGKSTIAKAVAARLGLVYVDTGAMYRAMALFFIRQGIQADDKEAIAKSCRDAQITIHYQDGVQQVLLNGENVSSLIREEDVGKMASAASVYQPVRDKLVELQQHLARECSVVMDGRDIGTKVLPWAQVKIYLTAATKVRAFRRYQELLGKGFKCNLEEIEQDIKERDYRDMNRECSPLMQAKDGVLVDTSQMAPGEVVEAILGIVEDKVGTISG